VIGLTARTAPDIARGFRMEIHYRDLDRLPPELEQGATYHDNDEESLKGLTQRLSLAVATGITVWSRSGAEASMAQVTSFSRQNADFRGVSELAYGLCGFLAPPGCRVIT